MRKFISLLTILAVAVALSAPAMAQVDHSASGAVGAAADVAGHEFVQGAKQIAKPFIVVGKTVIEGAGFVILKGEQGLIYIAEDAVVGAKYLVKGAKFVI